MCGIAGIIKFDGTNISSSIIQAMTKILSHRGPDDEGYLFVNTKQRQHIIAGGTDTPPAVFKSKYPYSPKQRLISLSPVKKPHNLALGHRRLSIVDLSPAGHQPMCNEDMTIWIVHNGEIYNFRELRRELQSYGYQFVSDTDTEVIVHAYQKWGNNCLGKFNGMWSFCIWDSLKNIFFCSRDRFGIKPFYYYFENNVFAFASEIKALLQLQFISREPNDIALYNYLVMHSSDLSKGTFFKKIEKLGAGEYLELDLSSKHFIENRYWDVNLAYEAENLSDRAYALKFHDLLEDSIKHRLISDVPIGTCLSGGIDSSSLVCMINSLLSKQNIHGFLNGIQKTFSARYENKRFDEGRFIEAVVEKTRVAPYYVFPIGKDLTNDLTDLVYYQEEPFGSTSIYAQWQVFKLASQTGIKVTLDGQGADELLAGYHYYFGDFFADLFIQWQWLQFIMETFSYLSKYASGKEAIHKIGFMLPSNWQVALKMIFQNRMLGLNQNFFKTIIRNVPLIPVSKNGKGNWFNKVLYRSVFLAGLPSLLRYDDKNSMAHSIESRVPFLDHRLVEFVFSLPSSQKIQRGITKHVLRNATKEVLPKLVRNRTDKMGFSTPEDSWFKGELKDTITQVLNSERFASRPFFNAIEAKRMFALYCAGKRNIKSYIWRWVNLELWLREFID